MAEHYGVLGLAAQIVSAHVSHNAVSPDQLPGLIRQVSNTLATAAQAHDAVKTGICRHHKAIGYRGTHRLP
jgi:predicted transcriptional regulator